MMKEGRDINLYQVVEDLIITIIIIITQHE